MKPLKLKCVLYTDDGETFICIRKFHATDVSSTCLIGGMSTFFPERSSASHRVFSVLADGVLPPSFYENKMAGEE